MSEQIFISYRREGGDVTAKLICEALKNRGFTVFYDYDSLHGGFFDSRILKAIEECNDFVLVLPPNSLDRCVNEDDWVRLEIRHALEHGKNIIPVLLPGFSFPAKLPNDIAEVARYNGVQFVMAYFDAVITTMIDRFASGGNSSERKISKAAPKVVTATHVTQSVPQPKPSIPNDGQQTASEGLKYTLIDEGNSYSVGQGTCTDTEIVIPSTYDEKPVTKIENKAFYKCSSLTSIVISENITAIANTAFRGCSSLTSVDLPSNLTHIGFEAFSHCSYLTSVHIPDNVKFIGGWAFCMCSSLASINIPNKVSKIDDNAFAFCQSLTLVNIPNSVIEIKSKAFAYCSSLENINYCGTVDQWNKIIFGESCFSENLRFIHCTDGDVAL